MLGAVLVFGLYNQITYVHVPPYELASSFADDRRFVSEIDRRLPEGAAVFQLPHLPFPEGGQQAGLFENDLLRGYLHSDDLRWSFGATKGRPEEWVDDLAGLPTATVLDAAAAAGFAGLYIDRFGYPDGAGALEGEVRSRLASEPLASGSGRLSFFDLREHARRLEATHSPEELAAFRQAVLEPFGFEESGFLPLERSRPTVSGLPGRTHRMPSCASSIRRTRRERPCSRPCSIGSAALPPRSSSPSPAPRRPPTGRPRRSGSG